MTTPAEAPLEAPVIPVRGPAPTGPVKARSRRDALIASVSTVVVFAILGYLVTASPGWPKVRRPSSTSTRRSPRGRH